MIYYKIEIFLPEKYIELMIERINNLGACKVGNYDYCASYIKVKGCWRPLESAAPFKGKKSMINYGEEYKLEIRAPEHLVKEVVKVIKEVHPYEEVLFNIIQLQNHLFDK